MIIRSRYKNLLVFIIFSVAIATIYGCGDPKKEMFGEWYIQHIIVNDKEIVPIRTKAEVIFSLLDRNGNPIPDQDLIKIRFLESDQRISLAGVGDRDVLFTWEAKKDSLVFTLDTVTLLNQFEQFPTIDQRLNNVPRKSNHQLLSLLKYKKEFKSIDSTINIWEGSYQIEKFKNGIKLIGNHKSITLLNVDKVIKEAGSPVDKIFGR